jgi:hypothetical protein
LARTCDGGGAEDGGGDVDCAEGGEVGGDGGCGIRVDGCGVDEDFVFQEGS